jgi:hypothetical protein
MSTDVTMQELELETAELLPARETLGRWDCGCSRGSSGHNVNQWNASSNGNGGNVYQSGFGNFAIGGGNLSGDLSGNNINL